MTDTNTNSLIGFIAAEITDLPALVAKLRDRASPLATFLLEKFSPEANQAITANEHAQLEPEKLKQMVAAELNEICRRGVWIYDPLRFEGVALRNMTRGVLQKPNPRGLDLAWLNRLLVLEAFRAEITPEADTLAAEWVVDGIQFKVYCEERPLARGIGISYKIVYKTATKWASKHAKSLEKALGRARYFASKIHAGAPPPSKPDLKARDAKAKAYDDIVAEVTKLGKTGAEILDFVKDAVKAQLALGLARPLLDFVIKAIEVMPKPVKRILLSAAFIQFKAFNEAREGIGKYGIRTKNHDVNRFSSEAAGCELLAKQLLQTYNLKGDLKSAAPFIDKAASDPLPTTDVNGKPLEIYADDVTALGLSIWLRRLRLGWKSRRDHLDNVRSFFKYLRDELRAIAQTEKTPAHVVPRPKREGKKVPISILWFVEVWRILLNVQDLETLFLVAIGVLAGLHLEEIRRLVWEDDIIWKDGEPYQIFIATGKAKDPHGAREGKYVDIRFPLNKILLLGKGRKGKIAFNKHLQNTKLMPLIRRLRIKWTPSIMRHTCTSYMYGAGDTIEQVAKQLRDRVSTLLRYYLRHLPKEESLRLWTLPVDVSMFESLPYRKRAWDWKAPLKPFPANDDGEAGCFACLPVENGPVAGADANQADESSIAPVPGTTQPVPSPELPKVKRPRRRYRWPSNLEFQVLLWEIGQKEISKIVGCRQTAVSARALELGFATANSEYWRLKKLGRDVEAMVPESVKLARTALQKLADRSAVGGNVAEATSANPESSAMPLVILSAAA